MFTPTPHQQAILDNTKDFLSSEDSVFILKGYAGTGKTTMIKMIVGLFPENERQGLYLMAPTGRAARVLGEKTGLPATTIHKAIYSSHALNATVDNEDIAKSTYKLIFPIMNNEGNKATFIVDEASMVSSQKNEMELMQFGTDILMDDLLTALAPKAGNKVIFIGDPAQLPPVGDNKSNALDEDYFKALGLGVRTAELTEVIRQDNSSTILKNAMKVRDLLSSDKYRVELVLDTNDTDFIKMEECGVVGKYLELYPTPEIGDSMIVCYTNSKANEYNNDIRSHLFPDNNGLMKGDILMVVQNNYNVGFMNGELIKVSNIYDTISISAPVYIEKGGTKIRENITIEFIGSEVTFKGEKGYEKRQAYICKTLLENDRAQLSVEERKAIYINFCIRHPQLKPGTSDFHDALLADPYFNALMVKYGYAVTGHKCQGGEWKTVFVDYYGRTGMNDDNLRWIYTATTRAQECLYGIHIPETRPFDKLKMEAVTVVKNTPANFRVVDKVIKTPFHSSESPDIVKAKYVAIIRNLEGKPYDIESVVSQQYREVYNIISPSGRYRFESTYNGAGMFAGFSTQNKSEESEEIAYLLNDESNLPTIIKYSPSNDIAARLYSYVCCLCSELDIKITNIVEHLSNYNIVYYFSTSYCSCSFITFYVDAKGFVTYGKPNTLKNNNGAFEQLVERLSKEKDL